MRRLLCLLVFQAAASGSEPVAARFSPSALIVASLAAPVRLDSDDLYSLVPNGVSIPHIEDATTEGWRDRYEISVSALVAAAKARNLEADALGRILRMIRQKEPFALLPLLALRARVNGKDVWVVYFNWELSPGLPRVVKGKDGPHLDYPEIYKLGHFRAYAFTIDTFEQVGFVTCG